MSDDDPKSVLRWGTKDEYGIEVHFETDAHRAEVDALRAELAVVTAERDQLQAELGDLLMDLAAERDQTKQLAFAREIPDEQLRCAGDENRRLKAEIALLVAERDRLRSLVRLVDLFGIGFVWRRNDGEVFVLDPTEVSVMFATDALTPVEAERDAARAELERQRPVIERVRKLLAIEDERARRDDENESWYVWWRNNLDDLSAALDALDAAPGEATP